MCDILKIRISKISSQLQYTLQLLVPPAALAALVTIATVPAAFATPASKYTKIKIQVNQLVRKLF